MSDYHVIEEETAADGQAFRAIRKLDPDGQDCNPREYSPEYPAFGQIVHKPDARHAVPQEGELADAIAEAITEHDFAVVARWLRVFHGAVCVIPTDYRAIHPGGRTDTDTVGNYFGIAYATRDACQAEGSFDLDSIEDMLRAGVSAYGDWAEGNVFGVLVQRADEDGEYDDDDSTDGVWGYLGEDHADEEGRRMLGEAVSLHTDQLTG